MAAYDPSGPPDMSEDTTAATNATYTYDAQDADEDDEEDYDPSSFNYGNGQQPTAQPDAQPATEAVKPKTIGGFVIEDEDEEEEEEESEGTSMTGAGDVPLASEPTQDSAAAPPPQLHADSLNGSTSSASAPSLPTTSAVLPVQGSHVDAASLLTSTTDSAAVADQAKAPASALSSAAQPVVDSVAVTPQPTTNGITAPTDTSNATPLPSMTQRLPHDKVGRLEDRIKEDPKADVGAWWELVQHYRDKDQGDNARKVLDRMLEVWPTSPVIYSFYLDLDNEAFDQHKGHIEIIFGHALPLVPSLSLWTAYLSYLRRVFPLIPDPQGQHRAIITQAFDAVLDAVGNDPDSTALWKDYIEFVKSGPGVIGGSGWQDLQKVDALRKAYQRAIKVPSGVVVALWKEYDSFEMVQNKAQGRKVLQEMSPHYMTARTAEKQLQQLTERLNRKIMPTLPPLEGCEGDDAFALQVQQWRGWVEWEKSDPLVLKDEDVAAYRKRVIFAYKQATIFLRFWPRVWYEAAEWCALQIPLDEDLAAQSVAFLDDGLKANPESVLLTLKKADQLEVGMQTGNVSDDIAIANGELLEDVFEPCHTALYALNKKLAERRDKNLAEVRDYYASLPAEEEEAAQANDDDDDANDNVSNPAVEKPKNRQDEMQDRIKAIQEVVKIQHRALSKTVSALWIAKMRAFRRIQGQGKPGQPKKGARGVFGEARPRGQLTADVYVASALIEYHCYKDPSAQKIFERGLKLFPTDETFAVEYIRHLIAGNDLVNARVVFETTVTKILGMKGVEDLERREKCRVLLSFMHGFESKFGDLAQVKKLENRIKELLPGDEATMQGAEIFTERFDMGGFDPVGVQLVLSPSQIRPKALLPMPPGLPPLVPGQAMPMGMPPLVADADGLRLGPNGPYMASPKRPYDGEDTDQDTPRKFMRAESPLKGAAGRRAQGHVASHSASGIAVAAAGVGGTLTTSTGSGGFMTKNFVPNTSPMAQQQPDAMPAAAAAPPSALPPQVSLLLQVLPSAASYHSVLFDPVKMVSLLRTVDVEGARGRF
ncbi:mRNA 3'-end-processing protein rna14 [Recurvomyces mirabilis]|uniref:mRNA 3'-end-processing protein RNA14 n=1 Tax=Recurvomyces mirabilis TaxID=574656 RepID=A0AAE1C431_9PEZI|nr:mRNA 3'-end-processing protein rna14 [Recurvomyces mirabilis]KAK5159512.1 mRNA 3'-end-processing protein rna14 [Recurvomyces mirabilis]